MSSTSYLQLLDATINHLEGLKARGARFVLVSPEALRTLTQPLRPASATPRAPRPVPVASAPTPPPVAPPAPLGAPALSPPAPAVAAPLSAPPAADLPPALSAQAKATAMAEVRARALPCVKCPHLAKSRRQVVFGVGSVEAALMFVGEAPGMDEDAQGEPFVGRAGQLLTRIIQTMGLSRETVYIANILKCRPDTPTQAFGNRKPTPEEMETCIPYLLEQIEIIRPQVLVALGGTAVEGLLGKGGGITRLRGQWQTFRGVPLMPTFHPSFLLRPENADKKRLVWQDMLAVMERLALPISEKQRAYFSTPT